MDACTFLTKVLECDMERNEKKKKPLKDGATRSTELPTWKNNLTAGAVKRVPFKSRQLT